VRVSVKVYPGTGPRLRDHIQAAIADALIRSLNNRWQRIAEVPVYRPVHGVIDLVLHDPGRRLLVAGEIQSELRRLEQLVRWSHEKRDALPSATFWGSAASDGQPTVSSLLVLRSSRMNRTIVNDHAALLQAIYPARAADAVAALVGDLPWPGDALVWARVESGRAEILEGPPRGVQLGR
jgi:hypothetical protein